MSSVDGCVCVHNSVAFSVTSKSYNHHYYTIPEYFLSTPPQNDPMPISIQSLYPPAANPWQLPILLSLSMSLFWTFLINGITQCAAFHDRLPSPSTKVSSPSMLSHGSGLPFFSWLNNTMLYGRTTFHERIYLLMGTGLFPPVGLLWIILL